jgi:hypothetical protein
MPLFAKHIDDLRVQRQLAVIARESHTVDLHGEFASQVLEIINLCHVI